MIHHLPNTYRAFYGAFQQLHPIQQQAIEPVLEQKDLIIQSATGSGKTEAVLAPCMERVIRSGSNESILYIVPTRALAADIYRRFKSIITERLGLGFAIRTGDVKHTGGGSPTLMLTTPESLDVMLGSSNQDLRGFLTRVRTVIIDEAHSFIHQYRGRQLVYLLQRLERRIGSRVQRIALSATLADPEEVGRFLGCSPDTVFLADKVSREIVPRLVHLENDEQELIGLLDDLYREWDYHKILIFANSRGRCDKIFGLLNRLGSFRGMAHLHYSNLTAKQRQLVERSFRKQSRSICIATSTLELGIDVGDVDAVLLFEPPDSVAAFLQRIGRANRRQNAIHFWGVCRGERAGQQVLRFLALLSLARQGRVEAALPKNLPSVLSQQIISCLYEKKRLSLAAVQDLFIDPIYPVLIRATRKRQLGLRTSSNRWWRNNGCARTNSRACIQGAGAIGMPWWSIGSGPIFQKPKLSTSWMWRVRPWLISRNPLSSSLIPATRSCSLVGGSVFYGLTPRRINGFLPNPLRSGWMTKNCCGSAWAVMFLWRRRKPCGRCSNQQILLTMRLLPGSFPGAGT